jgi:5-methylthioadenosine/S-adenosylhomocysteine deaminase
MSEIRSGMPAAPRAGPIVDEDGGPAYVLRGRVVTMNDGGDVFEDARVVVRRGVIVAITPHGTPLPGDLEATEIDVAGTIYPGLIDLHNHFVYNVLPLWPVPRRYTNRTQWPRARRYAAEVALPARALAAFAPTARALVRYVEAKALLGGTTTGQGIRTRVVGSIRLFRGAMRNVEETNDPRLPEAGTLVPDLQASPQAIEQFRRSLAGRAAYFYHLAEGIDATARRSFLHLRAHDLIQPSLVAIHALGLWPRDLAVLAERGAKIVWSPFSNLLLYGRTLNLYALQQAGVQFSIGCDWAPTGSKNLLQELKIARSVAAAQQADVPSRALVRAVTAGAARTVGWHRHVGVLQAGALADLVVIDGVRGDPYDHLIDATEAAVKLVVVHGIPRYGDRALMQALHLVPGAALEPLTVAGVLKALYLHAPGSPLNDLTFATAAELLRAAMADLPGLVRVMQAEGERRRAQGLAPVEEFAVELDNEYVPLGPAGVRGAAAPDWSRIAPCLPLDPVEVDTPDYWRRLQTQPNLDAGLRDALQAAYAG